MKRVHLIISGDVIGVGFRAWVLHYAQSKKLVGWVRNREDDVVEVVAEGERVDLEEFLKRCHYGPELAVVKKIGITWEKPSSKFMDFEVIY
jgi:acylphosphatase